LNQIYCNAMRTPSKPGAMNAIRKLVSPILNVLLEPVVCRIADRLRPSVVDLDAKLTSLHARLDEVERRLAPPFLSTVIRNEVQNIDSLPLPLLENLPNLSIVGYCAGDLIAIIPGCRVAPVNHWLGAATPVLTEGSLGNLLFLDEYHFMRTMERMEPLVLPFAESIIVATRFDFLPEFPCRAALHQLGFMEIALVAIDVLTGGLATFAVSHAGPVTCDPLFVDPRRPTFDPGGPTIWLVARKVASAETGGSVNA
jgi:hypothetical protein